MVNIKIYKGRKRIGGSTVEIATAKSKIIIDYGKGLSKNAVPFEIEGLTKGEPNFDGVFITHDYADHIDFIKKIDSSIPVYVEKAVKKICDLVCDYNKEYEKIPNTNDFEFNNPISINDSDIVVTPFIVDNSAFNSAMFLVKAEDKLILHTGDYRRNGYKGQAFVALLEKIKLIGNIDVLITEGTTLSKSKFESTREEDLLSEFEEIYRQYDQVFVLQDGTNIDRLAMAFKACQNMGHQFVQDIYLASITNTIKQDIPDLKMPNSEDILIYIPNELKAREEELKDRYLENIELSEIKFFKPYAMGVRSNMIKTIEELFYKGRITKPCLICSFWDEYREDEVTLKFFDDLEHIGIKKADIFDIHTSGRSDVETLKKIVEIINPSNIITIHTDSDDKMIDIFGDKVELLEDSGEFNI